MFLEGTRSAPWALVGWALMGSPGALWAGPWWALVGQALVGIHGALAERALVGPPGTLQARPLWAPLVPILMSVTQYACLV